MMMKEHSEKIKYFLLGIFFIISILLIMGFVQEKSEDSVGRYQISTVSTNLPHLFMVDTKTGVAKIIHQSEFPNKTHLGERFDSISGTGL